MAALQAIPRGTRVRLAAEYVDAFGQRFEKGQTGVIGSTVGVEAVVDFEGYSAERAAQSARVSLGQEGRNVVPWAALVPIALLRPA